LSKGDTPIALRLSKDIFQRFVDQVISLMTSRMWISRPDVGVVALSMARKLKVAARDLRPGDVFKEKHWSVLAVERPLSDTRTIHVRLIKPKGGQFRRELAADEVIEIERSQ
jgi:hypothetical protein